MFGEKSKGTFANWAAEKILFSKTELARRMNEGRQAISKLMLNTVDPADEAIIAHLDRYRHGRHGQQGIRTAQHIKN